MSRATCVVLCTLMGVIAAIVVLTVGLSMYRDIRYIEAGYTQKMLPGHSWPVWVKEQQK